MIGVLARGFLSILMILRMLGVCLGLGIGLLVCLLLLTCISGAACCRLVYRPALRAPTTPLGASQGFGWI